MLHALRRPRTLVLVGFSIAALVVATACTTFDAISFVNGTTGWSAGNGAILKTNDGGQNWISQYSGSAHIVGFDALNSQQAWAVGENTLLGTSDGGQTWTTLGEPSQPLLRVAFVNSTVGYGIASSSVDVPGSVVKTTDGGQTWQTLSTPNPAGDVCFRSATEGWAGVVTPKGPGDLIPGLAILHTTNGGTTWQNVLKVPPSDLLSAGGPAVTGTPVAAQLRCNGQAVWFLALGLPAHQATRAYRVYRMDSAGHWSLTLASSNAAPALGPLTFDSPDGSTAYVGGVCGACTPLASVLKTTDAGAHWTQLAVPAGLSGAFHLSFVSQSEGWLATNPDQDNHPGLIFHTTDGAQTWNQQYP